jgi:hypothetical protein
MSEHDPSKSTKESQPFTITLRPDGIIVTRLHNFRRSTIEAWMGYVRARDGKMHSPLRMLFDFRDAELPSKFLLDIIGPFFAELTIPEDTRNAYLFPVGPYQTFGRSLMQRLPPKVGELKEFISLEDAVAWLLEPEK